MPTYAVLETPQGYATELPVTQFLSAILPPLPHDLDVARVLHALLHPSHKSRSPITSRGRWTGFSADPENLKGSEDKAFFHLPSVVRSIAAATSPEKTLASLHINPNRAAVQARRHLKSFPDAYLSVYSSCREWSDIIAFGELTKTESEEDISDNINKVTSSMAKCMAGDPRRRFVFSFTIENVKMRLWFCDRSQILVSEPFNFITDHITVIHFFSALLNAGPADIGLDTTMVLLDNEERYDINLHSTDLRLNTYRTINPIFTGDQQLLRYNGTRVWMAVKVVDGQEIGDPVVLKDVWVDPNRRAEGASIEELCRAARDTEHQLDADSSFITVECHSDVYFDSKHGRLLDYTRSPVRSTYDDLVRSREDLLGGTTARETRPHNVRHHYRLVHYRIVFREVCRSLAEERSLATIFKALARIALVLQVMHSSGWVHRDVSKRNILLRGDGLAILSDFEYAKRVNDGDEMRIGTAKFMAVEVDRQRYPLQLRPDNAILPQVREKYPEKCAAAEKKFAEDPTLLGQNPSGFRYNALHDLESLWWIAAYYLIMKEVVDCSAPVETGPSEEEGTDPFVASHAQKVFATDIFITRELRRFCFTLASIFAETVHEVIPERLWKIAQKLEDLREELMCRYYAEELDCESIDSTSADGLHEIFHDTFLGIAELEENQGLTVRPFTVPKPIYHHPDSDVSVQIPSPPRPSVKRKHLGPRTAPLRSGDDEALTKRSPRKKRRLDENTYPDLAIPNNTEVAKRLRPYLPRRAKMRPTMR
ncbi:hypothetical protein NM688_g1023 [Phlebia brevispora]|uniref:Uncharacterized protein n=1 Tax=Phlebia brevispora TaxID=194682 RepID=A0ACC1TCT4_9APHY|nr:hypothetical protein NM688_g1023 [Phlebia brevispora]